ncbi:MAG TPA: molybdate ABC transporter substrate-binding protein, partial [Kiloniellales bacterium]|nr:molybdate ABC transporter substrate-binding protein [Kiloniellales bacterium]
QAGDDTLTLFAAASMTDAMTEAAKAFTAAGGAEVRLAFGSSSTLAKQIENGGPADLFISADSMWMDYLDDRDLIDDDSRFNLAGNALVLIAPKGSAMKIDLAKGADLLGALAGAKLAMGDPEHVPAGRYGKAALEHLGLWEAVRPSTVFTADVREALNFVDRGEAAAGIVYATDAAISQNVRTVATFPAGSHDPIVYPIALIRGHDEGMPQAFLDFLGSDAGADILKKHGFVVPAPNS